MAVNLNQYCGTVGVFNNRKLPLKKTLGPSLPKNILKTHLIEIVIFLIVLIERFYLQSPAVLYKISIFSRFTIS